MASANEILQRLGLAVLETVHEAGDLGAPSGALYAALMAQGATLTQFDTFMGTLTKNGMLILEDHCYTITEKGKMFIDRLKTILGVPQ